STAEFNVYFVADDYSLLVANDNKTMEALPVGSAAIAGFPKPTTIKTKNAEDCFLHKTLDAAEIAKRHSHLVYSKNHNNATVLGTHAFIDETDLCILVERERDKVFAPVMQYIYPVIWIICLLLLLLLVIVFFLSKQVAKPITELKAYAAEIESGNVYASLDIESSHDEIEEIADCIKDIVNELKLLRERELLSEKKRSKALEKEVAIKTDELNQKLKETEDMIKATMNILEDVDESRKQLEEEDVKKNELFNITSHELKTPLVPIKGYLELMHNEKLGKLNDKQKEMLAVVDRNVKRLSGLIDDILDVARLQSSKMKFNFVELDPTTIVKDSIDAMQTDAKIRGIYLKANIKPMPKIYGDYSRLMQVVTNLIKNAIKFTEKGGITVNAYKQDDYVLIDVIDTGVGIKLEDQEKLFHKFFQVDSSITRKFGGTGLGLVISRAITEAHGGTLKITNSVYGKGTTFTIKLPTGHKKMKEQMGMYGMTSSLGQNVRTNELKDFAIKEGKK
ncbi:MAG: ATP-binding protein, partial [Nanoarchaeota archaeon]|nr:ATP-binding protein [Nanoarchaeota archaeon]